MQRLMMGILLLYSASEMSPARAQSATAFDYRIAGIRMSQVDSVSGSTSYLEDLGALMYDIGPTPRVNFEIEVDQVVNPSPLARIVTLSIERYILLESKPNAPVDTSFHAAQFVRPTWVYSGPIHLESSRIDLGNNKVQIKTEVFQLDVLDPEQPLTFAHPEQYRLLGFAYRFYLKPASFRYVDTIPEDNVDAVLLLRNDTVQH